jgi:hypothetical protein
MPICKDVMKNRVICFACARADQAEKAMKLLSDVDGIERMTVAKSNKLHIRYDIRILTLQMLELALTEVGFALNRNIVIQIKRGLFAYCEEAQRSSLGIEQSKTEHNSLSLSDNYVHDPRPDNWRHYI